MQNIDEGGTGKLNIIDADKFIAEETKNIEGIPDGQFKMAAWGLFNDLRNFKGEDIVCPHCGKVVNKECE